MLPPRTYEVQAGYGLGFFQSEALVAWAIDALAAGYDSQSLRILAGLERPFDTEELNRLYAAVCGNLGIRTLTQEEQVSCYTQAALRSMLAGQLTRERALEQLGALCTARHYARQLYDFYLLYHAKSDLENGGPQWYWEGADTSNIDEIIDDYATQWLEKHGDEDYSR